MVNLGLPHHVLTSKTRTELNAAGESRPRVCRCSRAPPCSPQAHTHTHVPNITCPSLCQGSQQVPTIRSKSKLPLETGICASGKCAGWPLYLSGKWSGVSPGSCHAVLSQRKLPAEPHPRGLQSSCPNLPARETSHPKGFRGCAGRSSHEPSFLERVTLHLTVPVELKRPGLVSSCTDHPRAQGMSELGIHQRSVRDAEPTQLSPPICPSLPSAASSIKRRLKIRAESTSPAWTALRLFVPRPSSTLGCFTYQLLPWKFPLAGCELKQLLSNFLRL